MDGEVIEVVLKLDCCAEDLIPGLVEPDISHFWVICQFLPDLFQPPAKTDSAGHTADLRLGQPVYLGHFPDCRPGAKGVMIGHHGCPAVSVPGKEVINDLISLIPCEVHIDVGWIHPPRI